MVSELLETEDGADFKVSKGLSRNDKDGQASTAYIPQYKLSQQMKMKRKVKGK